MKTKDQNTATAHNPSSQDGISCIISTLLLPILIAPNMRGDDEDTKKRGQHLTTGPVARSTWFYRGGDGYRMVRLQCPDFTYKATFFPRIWNCRWIVQLKVARCAADLNSRTFWILDAIRCATISCRSEIRRFRNISDRYRILSDL